MFASLRSAISQSILQAFATGASVKLLLPLTALCQTVVESVRDDKLAETHEEVFAPALTALSTHADQRCAASAQSLLKALQGRRNKIAKVGRAPTTIDEGELLRRASQELPLDKQVEGWRFVSEVLEAQGKLSEPTNSALIASIRVAAQAGLGPELEGTLSKCLALLAVKASGDGLGICTSGALTLAKSAASDIRCSVATALCLLLPKLTGQNEVADVEQALAKLLGDRDAAVQAHAIHELGLLAQHSAQRHEVLQVAVVRLLGAELAKLDHMPPDVLGQASWAVANLSEAMTVEKWTGRAPLIRACVGAASQGVPEMTRTNLVRALGSAIERLEPAACESVDLALALRSIIDGVGARIPKSQWNAAYALQRSARNAFVKRHLQAHLLDQAISALAIGLCSSNVKVQSSCKLAWTECLAGALSAEADRQRLLAAAQRSVADQKTTTALETLLQSLTLPH